MWSNWSLLWNSFLKGSLFCNLLYEFAIWLKINIRLSVFLKSIRQVQNFLNWTGNQFFFRSVTSWQWCELECSLVLQIVKNLIVWRILYKIQSTIISPQFLHCFFTHCCNTIIIPLEFSCQPRFTWIERNSWKVINIITISCQFIYILQKMRLLHACNKDVNKNDSKSHKTTRNK